MQNPQSKEAYKTMMKKQVLSYWESKLRLDAESLPSLKNFKPNYMSLAKPHLIFTSAGLSPYEVRKASIQARMLSG